MVIVSEANFYCPFKALTLYPITSSRQIHNCPLRNISRQVQFQLQNKTLCITITRSDSHKTLPPLFYWRNHS